MRHRFALEQAANDLDTIQFIAVYGSGNEQDRSRLSPANNLDRHTERRPGIQIGNRKIDRRPLARLDQRVAD